MLAIASLDPTSNLLLHSYNTRSFRVWSKIPEEFHSLKLEKILYPCGLVQVQFFFDADTIESFVMIFAMHKEPPYSRWTIFSTSSVGNKRLVVW